MKFRKFKTVNIIKRKRNPVKSRLKKIRLEKNERVSEYEDYFLKKIKSKLRSEHISAYPEVEEIYSILARKLSINSDQIVITAGSDLAIKNCFELFISPGDEIVTLNPTYGMVDVYSKLFQAKQKKINYNSNLELDIKEIFKSINKKTSLVIIANPNSPTGTIIKEEVLEKIFLKCRKNNCYILIDECYFGYYPASCIKYIKKFNNLIISRSFSKIGLAGCRIGYLVASRKTAQMLYKFRPFYEISSFSSMVLKEILKRNNIFENYIKKVLEGKKYLMGKLTKLNINYYNTNTNFILLKFNSRSYKEKIKKKFANQNILVLGENKLSNGDKVLRITLGPVKYMRQAVKILKNFSNLE